jgi:hypothetical protein
MRQNKQKTVFSVNFRKKVGYFSAIFVVAAPMQSQVLHEPFCCIFQVIFTEKRGYFVKKRVFVVFS